MTSIFEFVFEILPEFLCNIFYSRINEIKKDLKEVDFDIKKDESIKLDQD